MWCALIHGAAPESPEAWWEGLALPLRSRKLVPAGKAEDIVSGEPSTYAGYAVGASIAFEVLGLHRKKEAGRWNGKALQCSELSVLLVFREEICEIQDGPPSVTLPPKENGKGLMSVEEFLRRLVFHPNLKDSRYVRDMLKAFSRGEWEKIASAEITRPLILLLCSVVAREAERRIEEMNGKSAHVAKSDSWKKGSIFFNEVHQIAKEQGIELQRNKIGKPPCSVRGIWEKRAVV